MDTSHGFISVVCGGCGSVHRIPVYCGNRFCSDCGNSRRAKIRYKMDQFLKTRHPVATDSYKHLTLTVRSDADLVVQTRLLVRAFRKMRSRALFKKHVRGGAFVIEVTKGDAGWHAHLHIIIESSFIPWTKLQAEWSACSGGEGCYIKRIHVSYIIGYLTKYITKSDLTEYDQIYASHALKGFRLFQPFGTWHGELNKIKPPMPECLDCGSSDWYLGDSHECLDAYGYASLPPPNPPPRQPVFVRDLVGRVVAGSSIVPIRLFTLV